VPADLKHNTVTLPTGIRMHYVEAGSGPLVVLLHGFPEFWYAWRRQIPALAEAGFRVVAPDQRGYGDTDKPRSWRAYRIEALAQDVAHLIEALGESSAHVVGHDWGGGTAWATAMLHPEKVERLTILNVPHPERMLRAMRTRKQLLKSWYVFFFQIPWLPETLLKLGGRRALRNAYQDARPGAFTDADIDLYANAFRDGFRAPINWYRAAVRRSPKATQATIRPIAAPTLVIWGERDRFLGGELAEPDPAFVPHVRVVRLPEATHWVQHDEPDAVNALLVEHLRG
jgi:pimeloyl-ACP methyl ester carboxylesterase